MLVRAHGLQARGDLNGKFGVVLPQQQQKSDESNIDRANTRYEVRLFDLENGFKHLQDVKVKAVNLEHMEVSLVMGSHLSSQERVLKMYQAIQSINL
jgi:hypothetical protein